ncbi:MAG: N-acetylmuramoyl-L-alanine amidase [Verrucomicrobiota bacterium]
MTLRHNAQVSSSRKVFAILSAAVLAGCASHPRQPRAQVPDWESQDVGSAPRQSRPIPAPTRIASPAPPAKPTILQQGPSAETWVSLNRWSRAKGFKEPCRLDGHGCLPHPSYSINTSNGVLVLRTGSQSAFWDGLELRLGFAPQLIDDQPFVHALDLKKTIEPLIGGAGMSFLKPGPVIVIDPGHGGENPGTRSVLGNRYEKEFTLDWARRLEGLLITNGWQVFLTRTNDTDLSLSNRVAFAQEHKAGLFLSLHFNSAGAKEDQEGLETYCLTPSGMPSTVTRGFGDDLALGFPNNIFDEENLQFAFRVHRALLQTNGFRDRGVRHARFLGVLRWQERPAILVEGGYLSNPREARLIADPAYRQKLAEAVAGALCENPGASRQRSEVRSQKPEGRPTAPLL